jgi:hypothetical protein
MEVRKITVEILKAAYEHMTDDKFVLDLLSQGVVHGISSIVQPPCEDANPF